MGHSNLLKSPEENSGRKENKGGDELIWGITHTYMEMS
jgi:hypothetical protein